ncbi:MAG: hypothetical protein WBH00_13315 [Xanthobacteraceae bacterium]
MRISFSPQRRDDALTVSKAGDALTINGDVVDLSAIPEGADLPATAIDCEWIVGTVHRVAGDLHVTLLLPHGPRAIEAVRFPADINPADGPIELPAGEEPEISAPEIVPEPQAEETDGDN